MKKFFIHIGQHDKMIEQASQHLYDFAINGCEQAKQQVLALDKRLAHRGRLSVVDDRMSGDDKG